MPADGEVVHDREGVQQGRPAVSACWQLDYCMADGLLQVPEGCCHQVAGGLDPCQLVFRSCWLQVPAMQEGIHSC